MSSYQANTNAIVNAKDGLQLETMDQLAAAANTLNGITSNIGSSGPELANTLDMEGREAAVELIQVKIKQLWQPCNCNVLFNISIRSRKCPRVSKKWKTKTWKSWKTS